MAAHGTRRDRPGTLTSVTSSRYHQEYPSNNSLSSIVVSPIRRASSETRLEVLHQKEQLSRLKETIYESKKKEVGSQELANGAPAKDCAEKSLQMEFEDCIEEHPKAKIWPKLLNFQNAGYKHTKLVVYYILVIIIGIPLTFIWACINGTVVFSCVWCWGPLLKLIKLCVFSTAPAITFPYQMWCSPIVDIFARLFRQIRLQAVVQKV